MKKIIKWLTSIDLKTIDIKCLFLHIIFTFKKRRYAKKIPNNSKNNLLRRRHRRNSDSLKIRDIKNLYNH